MEAVVERPSLQDQQVARESLPLLIQVITQDQPTLVSIQIQAELRPATVFSATVPAKALHLLAVILSAMAQGKAVSVVPADSEMSTQQAADLLNISRPYLVKLLETGAIPFKKTGTHRRILLDDLVNYDSRQKQIRRTHLDFLSEQAQAFDLGYE
jgi:excisionase family DNA binding protein